MDALLNTIKYFEMSNSNKYIGLSWSLLLMTVIVIRKWLFQSILIYILSLEHKLPQMVNLLNGILPQKTLQNTADAYLKSMLIRGIDK